MQRPLRLIFCLPTLRCAINSKASGKFAKMAKTPSQGMGNPLSSPNGILYEAQ